MTTLITASLLVAEGTRHPLGAAQPRVANADPLPADCGNATTSAVFPGFPTAPHSPPDPLPQTFYTRTLNLTAPVGSRKFVVFEFRGTGGQAGRVVDDFASLNGHEFVRLTGPTTTEVTAFWNDTGSNVLTATSDVYGEKFLADFHILFCFQPNAICTTVPPVPPGAIVATPGVLTSGTAGNDVIFGTNGNDTIAGGGGDDLIFGLGGADSIAGGTGNDTICGGAGNDNLSGGSGNDIVSGDDGNDMVAGTDGDDSVFGGPGADKLSGNSGTDSCSTGTGPGDVPAPAPSCDTITP